MGTFAASPDASGTLARCKSGRCRAGSPISCGDFRKRLQPRLRIAAFAMSPALRPASGRMFIIRRAPTTGRQRPPSLFHPPPGRGDRKSSFQGRGWKRGWAPRTLDRLRGEVERLTAAIVETRDVLAGAGDDAELRRQVSPLTSSVWKARHGVEWLNRVLAGASPAPATAPIPDKQQSPPARRSRGSDAGGGGTAGHGRLVARASNRRAQAGARSRLRLRLLGARAGAGNRVRFYDFATGRLVVRLRLPHAVPTPSC
jgi:hypothetical protein